ncbi:MAG: nucleoside deaminase [Bacteroidetes bacterium]|nr:nucleoside deaminase [Bacteroidota bacterium]
MIYHEQFMRIALDEARRAFNEGEVPVGAVVVYNDRVIGRGHNQTGRLNDPTAHAEMIAITAACTALERPRLEGCRLYVTLEPCVMCAGAIVNARVDQLLFGAYDAKAGATGTLYAITSDARLNHRAETLGGILDAECAALLREFFQMRRAGNAT